MTATIRKIIAQVMGYNHHMQYREGNAIASTLPGQALQTSFITAGYEKLKLNDVAGCKPIAIALENMLNGSTVDDAIGVGQALQAFTPRTGDRVALRIATSQTLVRGDFVRTDAAGNFVKWVKETIVETNGTSTTIETVTAVDPEYTKYAQVVNEAITTTNATGLTVCEVL